jgi:hypothetical protein
LHEAADERIRARCHDDRNRGGHRPCSARGNDPVHNDDVDVGIHQRHGKLRQAGDIAVAPLRQEHKIAPLHPAMVDEPAQESLEFAFRRWRSA